MGRKRWSLEEKRRIVDLTLAAGASVARVAQAEGVNANQVFQWRRAYRNGELRSGGSSSALLPVVIRSDAACVPEIAPEAETTAIRRFSATDLYTRLPPSDVTPSSRSMNSSFDGEPRLIQMESSNAYTLPVSAHLKISGHFADLRDQSQRISQEGITTRLLWKRNVATLALHPPA